MLSCTAQAGLGPSCPSGELKRLGEPMMVAVAGVRSSPIVGWWYPREPGRLARSVDAYLDSARLPDLGGTVVAVMAPHADHAYSGPVGALRSGFQLLPETVTTSRPEVVRGLGRALAAVLRDRAGLLVASADLSHYCAQEVAGRLDAEVLRRVEALDPDGVLRADHAEVVGYGAAVVFRRARGASGERGETR